MELGINEALLKDLEKELEYYKESAEEIVNDDDMDPKIPESTFVRYFLPFLLDMVERNEENYKRFVNNWIAAGGDLVKDLIVTDDNDTDKKLFKIPSLLAKPDKSGYFSEISYSAIIGEIRHMFELDSTVGERTTEMYMEKLAKIYKVDKEYLESLVNLYKTLYERYNHLKEEMNVAVSDKKPMDSEDENDEIELLDYED